MVGASKVDESWFKYDNKWINWLINIDSEVIGDVYRSSTGNKK